MEVYTDDRIVMTLDAGGTNFVFSALQNGIEIVDPINLQSNANDLNPGLKAIIEGFNLVKEQLDKEPIAISFAFPGLTGSVRMNKGDQKKIKENFVRTTLAFNYLKWVYTHLT